MDYNNLSTEELEKNFNPRESVENFSHYLEDSLLKSKDVKKQTHIYENIAYGKGPLQKLDIFGKNTFHINHGRPEISKQHLVKHSSIGK